ncbi:MAG TPA: SpoIIE family protein phosphatase, partial [Acidimicrobiia bacterium]|nr:SpoIIE family protein phosphatase [Acidimicrobiia bacterium]
MSALDSTPRGRLIDLGAEILDRVDAAILVVDLDGVVQYANPYCEHLYGFSPEELIGDQATRYATEPLTPELRSEIGAKILNGESWEGDFAVLRSDGRVVEVHAVDSPVFDSTGGVSGVISLAFDVTAERASREQLRQMVAIAQILRDVGQTLVEELDAERVMQTVTDAARRLTKAPIGVFLRAGTDDETFSVAALSGRTAVPAAAGVLPIDTHELCRALREPKPTCIDDLADERHEEGVLDGIVAATTGPLRSCIIAPVRARSGEVTGGMVLADTEPDRFTTVDTHILGDIADQAGIVLDIARLFHAAEHEIEARRRAEEVQRFLGETSAVLSWSLDYPDGYERLAELCVPFLADLCLIDVADENGIRRRAAVHADPKQARLVEALGTRFAPDPFGMHPAASVVRGGQSEMSEEMSDELLRRTTRSEEHYRLVKALDFTSYICVPLTARGRNLGALTLVSAGSDRRFGASDLALAEELARRAGLALDNARLFAERDHVARALQSSLLPPSLPSIPGVQLAARYRAAGEGNEVGGDFYDVFQVGRSAWMLVLGDVSGKGPEAAAIAGLARHTLRAVAMQQRAPRRLLSSLHETLVHGEGHGEFCTVCCALLQPSQGPEGRARLTIACAGHPPPVIRRADGSVELATCTGPLLGVPLRKVSFRQQVIDLEPGDTVVIYTDGVTEAHHRTQTLFGEERLMQVVAA